MIHSNIFVTGRCLPLILYRYRDLLKINKCFFVFCFFDTITITLVSGADYHVLRSFPALHFDVTKVTFVS